jgi:hypothetical protein
MPHFVKVEALTVSAPIGLLGNPNNIVSVPIRIDNPLKIESYNMEIRFDSSILEFYNIFGTDLSPVDPNAYFVYNSSKNLLSIGFYNSNPLDPNSLDPNSPDYLWLFIVNFKILKEGYSDITLSVLDIPGPVGEPSSLKGADIRNGSFGIVVKTKGRAGEICFIRSVSRR